MMTGKKDVAMKESKNDDIDHKNKVIIRISFADEVKHFFKNMHERRRCYNTFDTRVSNNIWTQEG